MSKFSTIIISLITICSIFLIGYTTLKSTKSDLNLRKLAVDGTKGLQLHNKYRKEHHVGPLKINKELTSIAQKYADYLASKKIFEHSKNKFHGDYMGENLYYSGGSKCDANSIVDATKLWYNEVLKYNYNRPGFSMQTGHFTQVVWKNTKEVGFGVASTKDKSRCYVVANYYPAGNYQGEFPKNVLRK